MHEGKLNFKPTYKCNRLNDGLNEANSDENYYPDRILF
jgi:hypothetical protein